MTSLTNNMDLRPTGRVLLISCYELGHQPLGVALPMGFLQRDGFAPAAVDIAVEKLDSEKVRRAEFVGISVPMHTALRLGVRVAERIREIHNECRICFYGLYAALNYEYLLAHGGDYCIGGEFEEPLLALITSLSEGRGDEVAGVITRNRVQPPVLKRLLYAVPARQDLPSLEQYAHLIHDGNTRTAGYVEASRGCLHLCTHCPIPPVYEGRFFAIPKDVVLEDIRRQVAAGATHISFGDPDFLNGPTHSLRVVQAMHEEFPQLTFDFTAKIQHLLTRGENLPDFAAAGCLFIISAVESLSDRVLEILDKRHTRADVEAAVRLCREARIALRPTWVAFTPWTTLDDYLEMLEFVESQNLIDHVDPVQFSIRLLIPPGSWIADLEATRPHLGELDESAFTYRWVHPDPRMDRLHRDVSKVAAEDAQQGEDPGRTFYKILQLARGHQPITPASILPNDRQRAPRLTESWFC
jgi:radical SAM superfamily enzyme YgiQ (UPF0313 family)